MADMKFETRQLSELFPAEYNPRVELKDGNPEYESLKKSIDKLGYVEPMIINSDGTIIGGHQRYNALIDLGFDEVPVIVLDVDKDTERAINVALNKIDGEWDEVKLKDVLTDIDFSGISLDTVGFSQSEFDDLCLRLGDDNIEAQEDDFDVDAALDAIKEPKSKRGDVYQLGRHRLMCGDSTDIDDVDILMDGIKADLLLTDPPYGVDYTGKTKDSLKIENDRQDEDSFITFLKDAFMAADLVMKPGAVFYIWHADSKAYDVRMACQLIDWEVRQVLIWVKNTMVLGRQDYQWKHEPCLYGWKEGASHLWASDRKQTTILEYDRPTRSAEHPTMKPVALFDYLMKNNTKGGDIVLDLFGGSGTTILVAEQNGRTGYLMEIDPKYCDVIIQRWETYTGDKAVKL